MEIFNLVVSVIGCMILVSILTINLLSKINESECYDGTGGVSDEIVKLADIIVDLKGRLAYADDTIDDLTRKLALNKTEASKTVGVLKERLAFKYGTKQSINTRKFRVNMFNKGSKVRDMIFVSDGHIIDGRILLTMHGRDTDLSVTVEELL